MMPRVLRIEVFSLRLELSFGTKYLISIDFITVISLNKLSNNNTKKATTIAVLLHCVFNVLITVRLRLRAHIK